MNDFPLDLFIIDGGREGFYSKKYHLDLSLSLSVLHHYTGRFYSNDFSSCLFKN